MTSSAPTRAFALLATSRADVLFPPQSPSSAILTLFGISTTAGVLLKVGVWPSVPIRPIPSEWAVRPARIGRIVINAAEKNLTIGPNTRRCGARNRVDQQAIWIIVQETMDV